MANSNLDKNIKALADGTIRLDNLVVLSGSEGYREDGKGGDPIRLEIKMDPVQKRPFIEFKAGMSLGTNPATGKPDFRTYNLTILGEKACHDFIRQHNKPDTLLRKYERMSVDVLYIEDGVATFNEQEREWFRALVMLNPEEGPRQHCVRWLIVSNHNYKRDNFMFGMKISDLMYDGMSPVPEVPAEETVSAPADVPSVSQTVADAVDDLFGSPSAEVTAPAPTDVSEPPQEDEKFSETGSRATTSRRNRLGDKH